MKGTLTEPERYFNDIYRIFGVNDGWLSARYLGNLIGLSDNSVRIVIRAMRDEGAPIVAKKNNGYKLAKTDEEILRYIDTLERDIETRQETMDAMKRILKGA